MNTQKSLLSSLTSLHSFFLGYSSFPYYICQQKIEMIKQSTKSLKKYIKQRIRKNYDNVIYNFIQRIFHIVIYKHTSLIDETDVFGWFLNMIVCVVQVF